MFKKILRGGLIAVTYFLFLLPVVSAHEVYVLDQDDINEALARPPINLLHEIFVDHWQFFLAALIALIVVVFIFFTSVSRVIENKFDKFLLKIKPLAGIILQLTLGTSLIASGIYHDFFGPELPIAKFFPQHELLLSYLLIALGVSLVLGLLARISAFIFFVLYIILITKVGYYLISYGTYIAEALAILLFGARPVLGLIHKKSREYLQVLKPYEFMILRTLFGASLIFAAFYAKLIHGTLFLDTIYKYNLTHYFPFHPMFLLLGAFIIEICIGSFLLLGFEIRFISLFFMVFLVLSLLFFQEAVWPHIILFGTTLALFIHGYDKYTVERRFLKRGKEPVL